MKYCGECGNQLIAGVKFCNNCGTKVLRSGGAEQQQQPKSNTQTPEVKKPDAVTTKMEAAEEKPAAESKPPVRNSNPAVLISEGTTSTSQKPDAPEKVDQGTVNQGSVNDDRLMPNTGYVLQGDSYGEHSKSKAPLILMGLLVPLVLGVGGLVWWKNQDTGQTQPRNTSAQASAAAKASAATSADAELDFEALKLEFDGQDGLSANSITQLEAVSETAPQAADLLGRHYHKKGMWEKSNPYLIEAKTGGVGGLDPMIGENYRRLFLISDSTESLRKANAAFAAAKGYDPNAACKHVLLNTNINKSEVNEIYSDFKTDSDFRIMEFYGQILRQYLLKSTGARLGAPEVAIEDGFREISRAGLTDTGLCRRALIMDLLAEIEDDVTDYVDFDFDSFEPNDIYSPLSDGYFNDTTIEFMRMTPDDYQIDFFIKAKNLAIGPARTGEVTAIPLVMAGYEAEYAKRMVDEIGKLSKFEEFDEDDIDEMVEMMGLLPEILKNMKKLTEDAEYKMTFWNTKCQAIGNEDLTGMCTDILDYSKSTGVLTWYQDIVDEF